jgi:hypothetical protein
MLFLAFDEFPIELIAVELHLPSNQCPASSDNEQRLT